MKIIECVPNFSEGRDSKKIEKIASSIRSVPNVNLLDIDPGVATNRTVFTFVGTPAGVLEAAFQAIKIASEVIDMSKQKGEHPRIGATDVCPFIPVANATMEDCIDLAKLLGERVGKELKIPVYLYAGAANVKDRQELSFIRQGEYEGLKERFSSYKEEWKPDYGPYEFNPKAGATVIGAREFLIAYNINLNTRDKKLAHDIALNIREAGRAKRDANGDIVKDENGNTVKQAGIFKTLKAIGWVIPEYKRAQISMNVMNYKETPLYEIMEEVRRQALDRGLIVTGSELVGLIPKKALIDTGKYYLQKMGASIGAPEETIIECAIQSLGLNDISKFDIEKRVVEYAMGEWNKPLINMKLKGFVDELSSDSKAPGGGSVAALCGALSAGLAAMVSNLTIGKKGYEKHFETLNVIAERAQELKEFLLKKIDEDTEAFNEMMLAFKTPKEERAIRVEEATKKTTMVPFQVLQKISEIISLAGELTQKGNVNALSDVGVSINTSLTAARGTYMNVIINLASIEDKHFKEDYFSKAKLMLKTIEEISGKLTKEIISRLENNVKGI